MKIVNATGLAVLLVSRKLAFASTTPSVFWPSVGVAVPICAYAATETAATIR